MQNVTIGLADVDPQIDTPNLSNYKLCTYFDGIVGEGETKTFSCNNGGTMGRYLIVQTKVFDVLTLCEVQAYESKFSNIMLIRLWSFKPLKHIVL